MAKTIAENLTSIANSKEAIRQAIVAKGQSCDETVPLSQYAPKISAISTGNNITWAAAEFYQCVLVDATNKKWHGYKAVLENGKYHYVTTITEGMQYTSVTPEVGKIYTVDALAQIAYLYDIGESAGACPYLSDCANATCPDCGVGYCSTHATHVCGESGDDEGGGGGGGGGKTCPNTSTCNEIECPKCKKKYCKTHVPHSCDGSNTDDPNDPGYDQEPDPELKDECPNTDVCDYRACEQCRVKYCRHHYGETHVCPMCGARPGCKKVECETCKTEYCTACDGNQCPKCSKTPAEDCTCVKIKCALPDCQNMRCPNHTNGYPCNTCGSVYCSTGCRDSHTCKECPNTLQCLAVSCAQTGCDEKDLCSQHGSAVLCKYCNKYYCGNHKGATKHTCVCPYGDGCVQDTCKEAGCETIICTKHNTKCSECNSYFCANHASEHSCACPNSSTCETYNCAECSKKHCHKHFGEYKCVYCNKLYCFDCRERKNHNCVCPESNACDQIVCKQCNTTACKKHTNAGVCTLCKLPYCEAHQDNHVCSGKCPNTDSCNNYTCQICSVSYCSTHQQEKQTCSTCKKVCCPSCVDAHGCENLDVAYKCETCGTGYSSESARHVCMECGKYICAACGEEVDGLWYCNGCRSLQLG